jgi:thiopeptide-type bacteriocin biosynthesis protein
MEDPRRARALIDAVLASFGQAPAPAAAAGEAPWSPAELGQLARARELFVAAGTERVLRVTDADRWLQLGVRCASDAACERFLGGGLGAALRGWREAGFFTQFFFMRKPPGARLRFRGADLERALLPKVVGLLEEEARAGRIAGHELGVYDEETHQFGGEVGMDIAHQFFAADSRAFLDLLALPAGGDDASDRETLSLLALNDLVAQIAGDAWERWDVWRNMRLAGRLGSHAPDAEAALASELERNRDALARTLGPREVLAELPAGEQEILRRVFASNEEIASRFRDAAQAGALVYGPRKTLPFFIVFHWNRWGFDRATQLALSYFMEALQNPKGP